jgi:transcriptional regulator of NAD metabolism
MSVYTARTNEELLHSMDVLVKDKNILESAGYHIIAAQDQTIIDAILEELKSRKES